MLITDNLLSFEGVLSDFASFVNKLLAASVTRYNKKILVIVVPSRLLAVTWTVVH